MSCHSPNKVRECPRGNSHRARAIFYSDSFVVLGFKELDEGKEALHFMKGVGKLSLGFRRLQETIEEHHQYRLNVCSCGHSGSRRGARNL